MPPLPPRSASRRAPSAAGKVEPQEAERPRVDPRPHVSMEPRTRPDSTYRRAWRKPAQPRTSATPRWGDQGVAGSGLVYRGLRAALEAVPYTRRGVTSRLPFRNASIATQLPREPWGRPAPTTIWIVCEPPPRPLKVVPTLYAA